MKNPVKLLFITRKWAPAVGGMETYSMGLTAALDKHTDLTVHALPGRKDGRPPSGFALLMFMVKSLHLLWANRKKYDIIHLGDMVLFPLAFFLHYRDPYTKKLLTIHGLDIVYGERRGVKPKLYKLFLLWAKHFRSRIDCYITNSSNTSRLAEKQGFHPAIAMPLGVKFNESFLVDKTSVSEKNKPYILFVGRLVKRKGAGWFAQNVLPRLPDNITLYVVGKIWDKQEAHILQSNPRVKYLGYVTEQELDALRQKASLIIMPNIQIADGSDVEGFGITALEAAARGIPLVASDLEGISDAVRHKETGFLVPSGEVQAWVDQIQEILDWKRSFRDEFSLKAQHAVQKHYSWERVAKDTLNQYQSLLYK